MGYSDCLKPEREFMMKNGKKYSLTRRIVELLITIIIIVLAVSIAVPAFLKNRTIQRGHPCNNRLSAIHWEKTRISHSARIGPGSATIPLHFDRLNYYLNNWDLRDGCPDGGRYIVGDINASDGTVIVPVCTMEHDDSGGGVTFGQDGLHIHRRSFVQDASGVYHRRAELTFADKVEQPEKESK